MNKNHFNNIVERVQSKLCGWSSNTTNFAGRTTLIQSVSSTIPGYIMQTMELPISVCDKLDRLNRNYLWGDTDNKKRIHLINWNKVCTGKSFGGLGIRKARNSNLALLAKLGWKIINQEDKSVGFHYY